MKSQNDSARVCGCRSTRRRNNLYLSYTYILSETKIYLVPRSGIKKYNVTHMIYGRYRLGILTQHWFLVWVDRRWWSASELTSTTIPNIFWSTSRSHPACTGTPNRLWILPPRTTDNRNTRTNELVSVKCESDWSPSKSSGRPSSIPPCSNSRTPCTPDEKIYYYVLSFPYYTIVVYILL